MPTTSQVLQLFLYNNTTDKDQLFLNFRDNLAGPGSSSNMQKIDAYAGTTNDRLALLESLPHTITVKATKDADNDNNFVATVDGFTAYKSNQVMLIYLPENNAGLTTIKINDTATTSLMKIGPDGTAINLDANDLRGNVGYLFQYDGTQLVAIGEAYREALSSATEPTAQFTGGIWIKQVAGGTSSIMIKQADGTYLEMPPSTKASIVMFNDATTLEAFKTTVLNRLTTLETTTSTHTTQIGQLQTSVQTNTQNIQSNLDKINILSKVSFNQNLLDNFDFTNPVNQRGQTEYIFTTQSQVNYTIDRWMCTLNNNVSESFKLVVSNEYISIQSTNVQSGRLPSFYQRIDPDYYNLYYNKQFTFSILTYNNILESFTFTFPSYNYTNTGVFSHKDFGNHTLYVYYNNNTKLYEIGVYFTAPGTLNLVQAKLEQGDTQTLAYKDINNKWIPFEIPNYEMMLSRCQRYFQIYGKYPNYTENYIEIGNGMFYKNGNNTEISVQIPLLVALRKQPTIYINNNIRILYLSNNGLLYNVLLNTQLNVRAIEGIYNVVNVILMSAPFTQIENAPFQLDNNNNVDNWISLSSEL